MDWSLIISILSLSLSVAIYFIHDVRIKKQERKINEYQLTKIDEERQEQSRAIVKAHIIKGAAGKRTMKVYNSGKSQARNVNFKVLTEVDFIPLNIDNIFPYELLNPQEGTEFIFYIAKGGAYGNVDKIKVETIWEDDNFPHNKYEQLLTL